MTSASSAASSAWRASQDPNSANSQFFIMFAPGEFLDGQYTIVGNVVSGMEVVDAIKRGEPPATPGRDDQGHRPADVTHAGRVGGNLAHPVISAQPQHHQRVPLLARRQLHRLDQMARAIAQRRHR